MSNERENTAGDRHEETSKAKRKTQARVKSKAGLEYAVLLMSGPTGERLMPGDVGSAGLQVSSSQSKKRERHTRTAQRPNGRLANGLIVLETEP